MKTKKSNKATKSNTKSKAKTSKLESEIALETYDEETSKDNISHNDIDSEIESLRRRVLEEEEDAKYEEVSSKKSQHTGHKSMASAMFELIPGILLGTLGIGHFHNHRIAKGFFSMIFYWLILVLEGYILFNLLGTVDINDLVTLGILFSIVDLYIIFVSTHSAYHGNE